MVGHQGHCCRRASNTDDHTDHVALNNCIECLCQWPALAIKVKYVIPAFKNGYWSPNSTYWSEVFHQASFSPDSGRLPAGFSDTEPT